MQLTDPQIDAIVKQHWPRTKQTTALRNMVRAAAEQALELLLAEEEKQEPVVTYQLSAPVAADTEQARKAARYDWLCKFGYQAHELVFHDDGTLKWGKELDDAIDGALSLATPADAGAGQALTPERAEAIWNALDGKSIIAGEAVLNWNRALRYAFARAIESEVLARLSTHGAPVTASHDCIVEQVKAMWEQIEGERDLQVKCTLLDVMDDLRTAVGPKTAPDSPTAANAVHLPPSRAVVQAAHVAFSEALPPMSLTSLGHAHVYRALEAAVGEAIKMNAAFAALRPAAADAVGQDAFEAWARCQNPQYDLHVRPANQQRGPFNIYSNQRTQHAYEGFLGAHRPAAVGAGGLAPAQDTTKEKA